MNAKKTAAGGIALVSSLGNLGPAMFTPITAWVSERSGSPVASLYMVIALYFISALVLLLSVRVATDAEPALAPG